MSALIDPEELPFTADEVFRAGCRFLTPTDAHAMAKHLAACGPELIAERAARRVQWHAAGVLGAEAISLDAWVYPEALLPALAAGSADAEARSLIERYWSGLRSALLHAAQRSVVYPAGVPTGEGLSEEAGSRRAARRGLAVSLPPFPPPTPAMEAAADADVAERRAVWDATVARFRGAAGGGSGAPAL